MRAWTSCGLAILTLAAGVVGIVAVRSRGKQSEPLVDDAQVVFEVRHVNHAWGDVNKGIIVTRGGLVQHFDGTVKETIARISQAEMQRVLGLIPGAVGGVMLCHADDHSRDRGTILWRAWVADSKGRSSAVELRSRLCYNESREAQELAVWLTQLAAPADSPCRTDESKCGSRDFVPPTSCDSCAKGRLCVKSAQRESFCVPRDYHCAEGDSTCACNGAKVCAGGRSHCREDEDGELFCVP